MSWATLTLEFTSLWTWYTPICMVLNVWWTELATHKSMSPQTSKIFWLSRNWKNTPWTEMILQCETRSGHILTSNISCRGARHFCSTSISYCRSSLASVVWHSPQTWNMVLKNNQQLICTYCLGLFPFILCNVPLLFCNWECDVTYHIQLTPLLSQPPEELHFQSFLSQGHSQVTFSTKKILIGDELPSKLVS